MRYTCQLQNNNNILCLVFCDMQNIFALPRTIAAYIPQMYWSESKTTALSPKAIAIEYPNILLEAPNYCSKPLTTARSPWLLIPSSKLLLASLHSTQINEAPLYNPAVILVPYTSVGLYCVSRVFMWACHASGPANLYNYTEQQTSRSI